MESRYYRLDWEVRRNGHYIYEAMPANRVPGGVNLWSDGKAALTALVTAWRNAPRTNIRLSGSSQDFCDDFDAVDVADLAKASDFHDFSGF